MYSRIHSIANSMVQNLPSMVSVTKRLGLWTSQDARLEVAMRESASLRALAGAWSRTHCQTDPFSSVHPAMRLWGAWYRVHRKVPCWVGAVKGAEVFWNTVLTEDLLGYIRMLDRQWSTCLRSRHFRPMALFNSEISRHPGTTDGCCATVALVTGARVVWILERFSCLPLLPIQSSHVQ